MSGVIALDTSCGCIVKCFRCRRWIVLYEGDVWNHFCAGPQR